MLLEKIRRHVHHELSSYQFLARQLFLRKHGGTRRRCRRNRGLCAGVCSDQHQPFHQIGPAHGDELGHPEGAAFENHFEELGLDGVLFVPAGAA